MSRFVWFLLAAVAAVVLSGCAELTSNEVHMAKPAVADASKAKSGASIRITGYLDERNQAGPRYVGKADVKVFGLSGKDIMLDRDVTDVVSDSMRQHLADDGLPVLGKDDTSALYELSGVVKELRYDVKARDQVSIKVDTTLKEVATGKMVWSGEVEQKDERFAGVSGNNKGDIANYLKKQLDIVTTKTAEAVNNVLQATRPDLFSLTPGTRTIPGVEVFVSPNGTGAPSTETALPKPVPGAIGTLVVRTEPAGAKVYLDGVYYGVSPLNIQMAAGIRVLEVKLKGYKTATDKIAVRVGALTEWETQLEK